VSAGAKGLIVLGLVGFGGYWLGKRRCAGR